MENTQVQAYNQFYALRGGDSAPKPIDNSLIAFPDRSQYLFERTITLLEAKAIKQHLELSKDRMEARLREIVIDSCQMSDDVLAEILAGAAA